MLYIFMTIFFSIASAFLLHFSSDVPILNLAVFSFFIIIMAIASAYRLENIGWMTTYAWLYFIPLFNIPLIYYCCHLPMNYVADGKVDLAGKIIRTIFLIVFSLPIVYILAFLLAEISLKQ